eukprot:4631348-Prymnesium_polylepis.1
MPAQLQRNCSAKITTVNETQGYGTTGRGKPRTVHFSELKMSVGGVNRKDRRLKEEDYMLEQLTDEDTKYILLPFGRYRTAWDFIMFILVAYTAIVLPIQIAFNTDDEFPEGLTVFEYVVDFIFLADIFLNFRVRAAPWRCRPAPLLAVLCCVARAARTSPLLPPHGPTRLPTAGRPVVRPRTGGRFRRRARARRLTAARPTAPALPQTAFIHHAQLVVDRNIIRARYLCAPTWRDPNPTRNAQRGRRGRRGATAQRRNGATPLESMCDRGVRVPRRCARQPRLVPDRSHRLLPARPRAESLPRRQRRR